VWKGPARSPLRLTRESSCPCQIIPDADECSAPTWSRPASAMQRELSARQSRWCATGRCGRTTVDLTDAGVSRREPHGPNPTSGLRERSVRSFDQHAGTTHKGPGCPTRNLPPILGEAGHQHPQPCGRPAAGTSCEIASQPWASYRGTCRIAGKCRQRPTDARDHVAMRS
jgi:hypothetical protein